MTKVLEKKFVSNNHQKPSEVGFHGRPYIYILGSRHICFEFVPSTIAAFFQTINKDGIDCCRDDKVTPTTMNELTSSAIRKGTTAIYSLQVYTNRHPSVSHDLTLHPPWGNISGTAAGAWSLLPCAAPLPCLFALCYFAASLLRKGEDVFLISRCSVFANYRARR